MSYPDRVVMRAARRASVVVAVLGLVACSSAPATVGSACSNDSTCSSVPQGQCLSGTCTRPCSSHADCGCAAGTTDADLAAGQCGFACENGECARVCTDSSQCENGDFCAAVGTAYSVCARGL